MLAEAVFLLRAPHRDLHNMMIGKTLTPLGKWWYSALAAEPTTTQMIDTAPAVLTLTIRQPSTEHRIHPHKAIAKAWKN